jgi:hypothetical protein
LPKKAAEERPLSPRYCPDIAAVHRVRNPRRMWLRGYSFKIRIR